MSQVTLQSIDLAVQTDAKGSEAVSNSALNAQESEFSQMFQRQVKAEDKGNSVSQGNKVEKTSSNKVPNESKNQEKNLVVNKQSTTQADSSSADEKNVTASPEASEQKKIQRSQENTTAENKPINSVEQADVVGEEVSTGESIEFLNFLSASDKLLTEENIEKKEPPTITNIQNIKTGKVAGVNDEKNIVVTSDKTSDKTSDEPSIESSGVNEQSDVLNNRQEKFNKSELAKQVQEVLNTADLAVTKNATKLTPEAGEATITSGVKSEGVLAVLEKNKTINTSETITESDVVSNKVIREKEALVKLTPDVLQTEAKSLKVESPVADDNVDNIKAEKAIVDKSDIPLKQNKDLIADIKGNENSALIKGKEASAELLESKALAKHQLDNTSVAAEDEFIKEQINDEHKSVKVKNIVESNNSTGTVHQVNTQAQQKSVMNNELKQAAELQLGAVEEEYKQKISAQGQVLEQAGIHDKQRKENDISDQKTAKNAAIASALYSSDGNNKSAGEDESLIKSTLNKEVELETNKAEQNSLLNGIKASQNPSIFKDIISTIHTPAQSDSSQVSAQVEAMSNKFVADNVQQVKNNQIQLNETINIHRKDFVESVKDKVMVMVNQKLQQVDIKLDPPELGNVQVRVNLQGDAATVNFVVQNTQAKDALEQHMGKLRDMLNESGVDVGEANVQQQQKNQDENSEFSNQNNNGNGADESQNASDDHVATPTLVKASATGVDFYA